MKKTFLLLIKYIPIIQMVGMLANNTLYYFDVIPKMYFVINYLIGNSVITCLLLYICSYLFGYCNWYRLIITANLINATIGIIDILFTIPITNLKLLLSYYSVCMFFLLIIIINKFKSKKSCI